MSRARCLAAVAVLLLLAGIGAWLYFGTASAPAAEREETSPGGSTAAAGPAAMKRDAAAPAPGAPGPAQDFSGTDRFAAAEVIASRLIAGPAGAPVERWRIVRLADRAAPLARVVDHLERDVSTGRMRIGRQEAMAADSVLVAVPAGGDATTVAAELQEAGFRTAPAHRTDPAIKVLLPGSGLDAVPQALDELARARPAFRAEPNVLWFPLQTTPDDFDRDTLWGLADIEAPGAWTVTHGSSEVVVAVIDTGVDLKHPDLSANLWTNPGEIADNGIDDDDDGFVDDLHGWNFADDNADVSDHDSHGTHVAGTIGAVGDNGIGVVGVAWQVRIVPLRVGNGTFEGFATLKALSFVNDLRARGVPVVAVNASFGGGSRSSQFEQQLAEARDRGILFVAAAGNDGTDNDAEPFFPANYDLENVVSVAAVNQADGLSSFSNHGATTVDLAAPGTGIRSTVPGGGYAWFDGTSMAAPHVTGAAALLAAAEPQLNGLQIRARLLSTVEQTPQLDGRVATGGRLNLRRALRPNSPAPRIAITVPAAHVVVMDRAQVPLALSASMLPDGGAFAAASLSWEEVEGPGTVQFSAPTAASTSALFPVAGVYRVRVRASADGLQDEDELVVSVGAEPPEPRTDGLEAWWRFDEDSGAATDSSGAGRTGTIHDAERAAGVEGRALRFDGLASNVSFSAPDLSQLTIAAWVRADAAGDSIFPRIVHMRDGLLFFGLDTAADAADGNKGTLKFALDDGAESRVWHSPPGSVSTGTWYHVAATFDATSAGRNPSFYVDGARLIPGVQAGGGAAPPTVEAGKGFIGDRGDGTRAWDGLIDDVRVYARTLSAAEIAELASRPAATAILEGELQADVDPDQTSFSVSFAPAEVGEADPTIAALTWGSIGGGVTFADPEAETTTASVTRAGDYVLRLDVTTDSGLTVVRTLPVHVDTESLASPGRYTGGFEQGGNFTLDVTSAGRGVFIGTGGGGVFQHGFAVDPNGVFSFQDRRHRKVSGRIGADGRVEGTVESAGSFAGERVIANSPAMAGRDGIYDGWILDTGVRMAASVNADRIALVAEEAGPARSAEGPLASDGSFSLETADGGELSGQLKAGRIEATVALSGATKRHGVLWRLDQAPATRLENLSVRGVAGRGDEVLIAGFVVGGPGELPVLVRGVGPGLAPFHVGDLLARPRVELIQKTNTLAENAGWDAAGAVLADRLTATAARVGAFSLKAGSSDAALLFDVAEGPYTAQVSGADGGTGTALAEIYDAREDGKAAALVNLSARGPVGTGDKILIGGFVVAGDAPVVVLVRAAGPSLKPFGVQQTLAEPVLTVFRKGQSRPIASSGAWSEQSTAVTIADVAKQVGAFSFPADAKDAALVLALPPGAYTAQVSGANGATGIALVEIYLVGDE